MLHQCNHGNLHPEGHWHLSGQNASSQKKQSNYYLTKMFLKLCYSPSYHDHHAVIFNKRCHCSGGNQPVKRREEENVPVIMMGTSSGD